MAAEDFPGNSNYELQATIARSGTTVSVSTIRVHRKTGTGYWTNSSYPWEVRIGSTIWDGTWTYDFTGGVDYQTVTSNKTRTGIPPGSTFTVRVEATMGSGIGTAVISQSVTIPDVPAAPATPTVSGITASQFVADWNAPSNGGSAITGYDVQVNTSASATGATTYSQGTTSSRTITGRNAATDYYVRVRATNAMGDGAWSGWRAVTTLPVAPTSPLMSSITANSMTAAWGAGSNGSAVDEYQFEYNTSASSTGSTVVSNGTSRSRSMTGLTGAETYFARVRARSASGWGPWSPWGNGTTLPVVPGAVALGSATTNSLDLSYTRGSNGDDVTGYTIQYNTSASETGATQVDNGTSLTRTLVGLTPGNTYYARVRATSSSGAGAWSSWVSAATLPSTPPAISVSPASSGQSATISLAPPNGVSSVTKYAVEYRRVSSGSTTSFETTSTSVTRTGLQPGISYQWRASAFLGTYQTPWSSWVTVIQPNPTWLPGDYLAGSLAAGLDVTYAWTGGANASTSTVTGVGATGWACTTGGVIQRITGGLFGGYAARVLITSDQSSVAGGMDASAAHRADAQANGDYYGSIWVRSPIAMRFRAELTFLNGAGTWLGSANGPWTDLVPNVWTRLMTNGIAPATAVYSYVRVNCAGPLSAGVQSGDYYDLDGAMITLGAPYDYFDGSFPDTTQYDYAWQGTAHASVSSRTTLTESSVDPLQDPDCPPVPLAPRPPAIAAECIDEVGVWRRYWSIVPASEITRWLALIPTFTLRTTAAVGQVRIRVYENPTNGLPAALDTEDYISEQLVTFIPANTDLVIDGVSERTRAKIGASTTWLDADHLLQGTGGGPATWPVLSCGIGYIISYDVPLDQPDGNLTPSVALTRRQ